MKKLALLLSLLLPATLHATTFYVAKSGSGGNDSNSCTQAQTHTTGKLTINGVIPCLTAANGDVVEIKTGTYTAPSTTIPSGSSFANAVTFTNYQSDVVTIQGWDGLYGNGNASTSPRYIIFDSLIFNCTSTGRTECTSWSNGTHHIRFTNGEITGSVGVCGVCMFSTSPAAAGEGFNEILNSNIHHNGVSTQLDHGIYAYTPGNLIQGNQIHHNASSGISIYKNSVPIGTPGMSILANTIYANNLGVFLWDGNSTLVANNLLYENATAGFSINRASNSLVYNNTVTAHAGMGFEVRNSDQVSLRNNIGFANSSGQNFVLGMGATQTIYSNNLSNDSSPSAPVTVVQSTSPFTNSATDDYTLAAGGNLAVDGGTTISAVTTDIIGSTRPQGLAYDIGAYEKLSAAGDTLTLSNPNSGTLGAAGSSQTFTWGSTGTIANVRLRYDNDGIGFGSPTVLSASTTNDGSFSFTAPAAGTTYRFEVCDAADNNPCDYSDSDVTITAAAGGSITAIISDNTSGAKVGTINGTTNALLGETQPTTNFGAGSGVRANKSAAGQHSHSVLKFPIPVVSGATVTAAELGLYLTAFNGAGTPSIDFRNNKRAWVQSEATWNSYSTGNAWGTAGGLNNTTDRDSTVLCNMSISATTFQYYTCSSAGLTAWVQAAMDGGANQGLHLERNGTGNDGLTRTFASNSGDSAQRPYLSVTYTTTAATITVTQPIASSHFFPGDSMPIRWTSAGLTGNVQIDISYNGGTSYQPTPIIASHPYDQSDAVWTVTGPACTQCVVKVTSLTDSNVFSVSSAFKIAGTSLSIR